MSDSERFEIPVLLVVFNRPDTTKKVLECLERIKPTKLYVASDGPRTNVAGEVEKCRQVQNLFDNIGWKCSINTLFRKQNLRGPDAVSQAITWFFSHEEKGIILEDDILPNKSFFKYSEEMLTKYQYDEQVMHISGFNFGLPKEKFTTDYYFSGFVAPCWGWATWRRAWTLYSWKYMNDKTRTMTGLLHRFDNPEIVKYYSKCLTRYNWDYQWMNTIISNNGLGVIPRVNMIDNIGFGPSATHTKDSASPLANIKSSDFQIRKHPNERVFDSNLDNLIFDHLFNLSFLAKVRLKLRRILKMT